ncbi:unnamed protein product [Musa textilis]
MFNIRAFVLAKMFYYQGLSKSQIYELRVSFYATKALNTGVI